MASGEASTLPWPITSSIATTQSSPASACHCSYLVAELDHGAVRALVETRRSAVGEVGGRRGYSSKSAPPGTGC
jgi:hypothetical protein